MSIFTTCINGMKIYVLPFITTVTINNMYQASEWVPNQKSQAYMSVLYNAIYNH